MSFELFSSKKKNLTRAQKIAIMENNQDSLTISISGSGFITINTYCWEKYFAGFKTLEFWGDSENGLMGLKPSNNINIKRKPRKTFSATPFLNYLGIPFRAINSYSENYSSIYLNGKWDNDKKMLIVNIKAIQR